MTADPRVPDPPARTGTEHPARRTIEAVWRIESTRVIAGLARFVRDVGMAEEFAQDALLAALEQWPAAGVPDNPGAWLMTVGKRRAIDHLRAMSASSARLPSLARSCCAVARTPTSKPL